jgi:hypothetical protein
MENDDVALVFGAGTRAALLQACKTRIRDDLHRCTRWAGRAYMGWRACVSKKNVELLDILDLEKLRR